MKSFCFLLLAASAVAGAAPLTSAQKAEVRELTRSAGRIATAAAYAKSSYAGLNLLDWRGGDPVTDAMSRALEAGNCAIPVVNRWDPKFRQGSGLKRLSMLFFKDFTMGISGGGCPVELAAAEKISTVYEDAIGDMSATYRVRDTSFRALNDVDAFDYRGQGDFHALKLTNRIEYRGGVAVTGWLHSQRLGDVPVVAEAKGGGAIVRRHYTEYEGGFTVRIELKLPTYTAELKWVATYDRGKDQPNSEYFLNDEALSRYDFEAIGSQLYGRILDWEKYQVPNATTP